MDAGPRASGETAIRLASRRSRTRSAPATSPSWTFPSSAGRPFAAGDSAEAPRVAIVNHTLARLLWPDGAGRRPPGHREGRLGGGRRRRARHQRTKPVRGGRPHPVPAPDTVVPAERRAPRADGSGAAVRRGRRAPRGVRARRAPAALRPEGPRRARDGDVDAAAAARLSHRRVRRAGDGAGGSWLVRADRLRRDRAGAQRSACGWRSERARPTSCACSSPEA